MMKLRNKILAHQNGMMTHLDAVHVPPPCVPSSWNPRTARFIIQTLDHQVDDRLGIVVQINSMTTRFTDLHTTIKRSIEGGRSW